LWHWADELSKAAKKKSAWVDLNTLHMALLNITPEGKLQRETKDIMEELKIMMHIVKKQKEILKRFKRHGMDLLDFNGDFRNNNIADITDEPRLPTGDAQLDGRREKKRLQFNKWRNFTNQADTQMEETEDRLEELEYLHRTAEDVCNDVRLN
jgi:hypothetical protein